LRAQLRDAAKALQKATKPEAQEKAKAKYEKLLAGIERSVAVYGAINLRTDGHCVVMGYKIERPRSKDKGWDLYRLEPGDAGGLRYVSKHEEA
jgi:hypothetical protein